MKNLYMAQPNSQYGNSVYFPYAAGSLVAYAFEDEQVKSEYEFKNFFYKRQNIDKAVGTMEKPFIVGFSCYVWNYEYNKIFAKAIKEKYPRCVIVFGGHQVNADSDVCDLEYVDYVLLGEGEESFRLLLLSLCGKSELEDIPNIIYRHNGEIKRTKSEIACIPQRVSPYLKGYFDSLVEDEELEFSSILETNRGCPNKCAFCDWGNIKSRVRMYDIETVHAEIDWMSEHKIEYCYCADANFGLFPRDEEIVDYLIDRHNKTGYPQKFQATYSKNNPDKVFRINKRLNEAGMCKGATLSFQSMSQDVLDNIYRKNMPLTKFHELMRMYNSNGISAYSEIILGLPGETYESFRDGIEQLLEYGQHMSINFFNCELLTNSIMNDPEYISKYKIRSVIAEQHQYHVVPDKNSIKEFSRMVVGTSSLPVEKWIDCNVISSVVRAFHNLGLLQCFAIYLYYEKGVRYTDFYEKLILFAKQNPNTVCGKAIDFLYGKYKKIPEGNGSFTCSDPDYGELIWPLDEGTFLMVAKDYYKFYDEITPFLKTFFDDEALMNEILSYQKAIVKNPCSETVELSFKYDWFRYFSDIYQNAYSGLKAGDFIVKINAAGIPHSLPDFAREIVWFGRRGGQNIIKDIKYLKKENTG